MFQHWYYRKSRPDCETCKSKKKHPDCVKCGLVEVMPANYRTFGMLENYAGIFMSDGSIQSDGIRLAMEIENIPIEERKELTEKIIIALSAAIQSSRGK